MVEDTVVVGQSGQPVVVVDGHIHSSVVVLSVMVDDSISVYRYTYCTMCMWPKQINPKQSDKTSNLFRYILMADLLRSY